MYRQIPSTREVGEAFGVHHSTVARIVGKDNTPDTARDSRDTEHNRRNASRDSRDSAGDDEHNNFRLITGGTPAAIESEGP